MAAAELRNQSMELERDKIQLERLKVQKELRLMKDSDMNNEVEIAEDDSDSGGVNDLNKWNWPMCVQQQAPELCNVCKVQLMHHVCQTEAEWDAGLDDGPMKKICYTCHHGFKKTLHVLAV